MIAVLPRNRQTPEEHTLLYIEEPEQSPDDKSSTSAIFKSLTATNLPVQFTTDFSPISSSYWLLGAKKLKLHIVVSTGSGTGQAIAFWGQAFKPLLQHIDMLERRDYSLHMTASDNTVTELAQDVFLPAANDGVAQTIVLLSGDGGVVDMVNAVHSGTRSDQYVKPGLAVLPFGTGNALAHSTAITADNTHGLATLLRGTPKPLPVFHASFSPGARLLINEAREQRELPNNSVYGAVVCSWGLHATLVADSDTVAYRKFGVERFKMAANEALYPNGGAEPHRYWGRVSIRRSGCQAWEQVDRDEHAYVLATLVSSLEKGFTISPSSRPLDGMLRLVHFGPMSGDAAMGVMTEAYQGGKHVYNDKVAYEDIDTLRIEFGEDEERWRRVCVDGKIVLVEAGGWVEVSGEDEAVLDLVALDG